MNLVNGTVLKLDIGQRTQRTKIVNEIDIHPKGDSKFMRASVNLDNKMDTDTENGKMQRTKENRNKNYAPMDPRLKTLEKSDCQAKFTARQEKTREAHNRERIYAPLIAKSYDPWLQRKKKQHNRDGYKQRVGNLKQLPFALTPERSRNIVTLNERMALYTKRHRCEHKMAHNRVEMRLVEKHVTYQPFCDHNRKRTFYGKPSKCPYCYAHGSVNRFKYEMKPYDVLCNCSKGYCNHCKRTLYASNDSIYCYDPCTREKNGVYLDSKSTTIAPWAPKAKALEVMPAISEKKEIPTSIGSVKEPIVVAEDPFITVDDENRVYENLNLERNKVYTIEELLKKLQVSDTTVRKVVPEMDKENNGQNENGQTRDFNLGLSELISTNMNTEISQIVERVEIDESSEKKVEERVVDEMTQLVGPWQPVEYPSGRPLPDCFSRVMKVKIYRIPRKRPEWTRSKDAFLLLVNNDEEYSEVERASAPFLFDYYYASYYLHLSQRGEGVYGDFEFNYETYKGLLHAKTDFTKDELEDIFYDGSHKIFYTQAVKTVAEFWYYLKVKDQVKIVEPEIGGAIWDMSKSIVTSISDYVVGAMETMLAKIYDFSCYIKRKLEGTWIYNRLQGFVERLEFVVAYVSKFYRENPMLLAPLVGVLVEMMSTPVNQISKWKWVSLLGLLCGSMKGFVDAYKEKFKPKKEKKSDESKAKSSDDRTTKEFLTDVVEGVKASAYGFFDILGRFFFPEGYEEEVEGETEGEELYVDAEGAYDDAKSYFMKGVGYTREQFNRFYSFVKPFLSYFHIKPIYWSAFVSSIKTFTGLMAGAKSMVWFVTHFARWFPQFIVDALVSGSTRDFLATELRKKDSPFAEAVSAAMAMELALVTGNTVDLPDLKAAAGVKQEMLIKYIHDRRIPVDSDMATFLKNLKQYLYAPSVARAKPSEPFTILVSGDPGVGKSALTMPLLSSLIEIPDEVKDEDIAHYLENFVYTRNVATDTWEGYTGQPVIRYDDLGQFTLGMDFMEVIGLKTTAPYYPAYASIDPRDEKIVGVKGMRAEPKVIFASSNMTQLMTDTVTNLQALNRRWDVHFTVTYKADWNESMQRPRDNSHLVIDVVEKALTARDHFSERRRVLHGTYEDKIKEMQKIIYDAYQVHCEKEVVLRETTNHMFARNKKGNLLRVKPEMSEVVEFYLRRGAQMLATFQLSGQLMNGFDKTLSFLVPYIKKPSWMGILRFGAIIASVATSMYAVSKLMGSNVEPESGETKDRNGKQLVRVKSEASEDKELYQILTDRNIVRLKRTGIDGLGLSALFVESNVLLVPEHFFLDRTGVGKYIPKDTLLSMQCPVTKSEVTFAFDPMRMVTLKNNRDQEIDAVLYKCELNIPSRKTIINHFSDASIDLKNRKLTMGKWNVHGVQYHHGTIVRDNLKIQYEKGRKGQNYLIHNSIEYDIMTGTGDCGSPLIIHGLGALKGSIIGIHVAGDHSSFGDSGFGVLVTRSMLETALNKLRSEKGYFTEAAPEMGWNWKEATADDLEQSRLEGTITLAHIAPTKIVPPFDCKEIQPSPLFDQISVHITEPVKMRVRGRDIFLEGVLKYKMQAGDLGREKSEIILEHLKRQIYPMRTVAPRQKVTTFVAMNGTWQYPYLDRLDYDTSAGFPYYGKKKADVCVKDEHGDYYPTEDLQANLNRLREQISSRVVPVDPIFDSLKVERKKIKYDEAGNRVYKTRLFSACPFTMLILMKEYFSGFFSHMVQSRINHFAAVGMNKEVEFNRIATKHLKINDLHYDFDYQHFDGVKDIQGNYFVVGRLIIDFFEDHEYTDHRETLMRWAMNSPHQFREFIIWIIGCSSGVYMTELMQSIDNAVNIRGEWLRLAPHPYKTMIHFDKNVVDTNYGDDLILTVSEFAEEFFNGELIRAGLKERGVTITPADKVSKEIIRKPIEKISFLKCFFTRIGDRYYPKMELEELLETINWIRVTPESPLPEEACEMNCRDVMRGMFYHGKELYDKYYNLILSKRPTYKLYQYKELECEFREKGMIADLTGLHTLGSHTEVEKSDYYSKLETKTNEALIGNVMRTENMENMDLMKVVVAEMEASDVQPGQASTERVGVELINQKEPTTTAVPVKVNSKAVSINPETPFTLEMSLKRFTKFDDLAITATTAIGAVIKTWDVIEDLLTGSNAYPYAQFLRWKCTKITIQIQVTGCQFSSGKDILCWRPTMRDKTQVSRPVTLDEAILLQHVAINPTSNTTAEMVISPTFYKEWLSLDQKNQYGQLVLIRQNPFGVGSGPATYGLKLLASVEGADFILPAPLTGPTRSVKQQRDRMERVFQRQVDPRIPRVVSPEMEIQENADIEELPLYVFAVGSGETRDTDPPHWGEKYTSFQDMIKRQEPAALVTVQKLASDVGVPHNEVLAFQVGYSANSGGSFLRKVSLPFRVCKIPRRYVVRVGITHDGSGPMSVRGYVGYLPVGIRTPTTDADYNVIKSAFPYAGAKLPTALPYSYFDDDTIAEIEVPYTNPTSVALIPQDFDVGLDFPSNVNYVDEMRLIVNYYVEGDKQAFSVNIEVFEMAADEARVGVFVAMPAGRVVGNQWPDYWTPARSVKAEAGLIGGIIDDVGGALKGVVKDVLPDSVTGMTQDLLGALLDAPNVSTTPELMRLKKRGYYSNTTQVVMMERLSASAGAMQPMDPGDIGTTRDEMKLIDFARRRALLHTMAIPVTEAAETTLYGVAVGPMLMKDYYSRTTILPLDYVASGMQYWRGGIEFELEFVTSNYDEFKVEVTFSPDTVVPPNYESASTQYYKSVLVKGTNNRFRFKVPHFAEMPWKQIWQGQDMTSSDPNTFFSSDYSHGILQVFLGSNISSPTTTPNTIYMNVYVRAADDFEVAVPSFANTSLLIGPPATSRRVTK